MVMDRRALIFQLIMIPLLTGTPLFPPDINVMTPETEQQKETAAAGAAAAGAATVETAAAGAAAVKASVAENTAVETSVAENTAVETSAAENTAVEAAATGITAVNASDTVKVAGTLLLNHLEEALAMAVREGEMVMIAEAGEVSIYRLRFDTPEPEIAEQYPGRDLDRPEAVATVMDTYTVVATEESGHVQLLDEEMEQVRSLSVPSWVTGNDLFQPVDVTANDIGELFVLDRQAQRIYHFNANGSYLVHMDLSALQGPSALSHAAESLFLADREQGRVFVLTESGHELASIGTFPYLNRVRVYEEFIWILSGNVIHLFDMYGEHTGNWQMEASDETLQDIAVIDGQVFLLTSSSLYYLGLLP